MVKAWKKPKIRDLDVEIGVLARSPIEGPPGEFPGNGGGESPSG